MCDDVSWVQKMCAMESRGKSTLAARGSDAVAWIQYERQLVSAFEVYQAAIVLFREVYFSIIAL